ncbi:MAG: zinc dependent phospholipase C family protein [Eubacteriales bacterium]
MSDVYNHYFCGIDTISYLPHPIKNSLDKPLFLLGTQGADIFFYYNILNWKHPVPYGTLIHHKKINLFFYHFLEYIQSENDIIYKNKLYSYFLGFICHHALDRFTHPFIIYHCGIQKSRGKEANVYKYMHKKLEILLDVALLKYKYNFQANQYNIQNIFKLPKEDYLLIEKLYQYVIFWTYGINFLKESAEKSVKIQGIILSFLKNNSTFIKTLIKSAEKLFSIQGYITTGMYPNETDIEVILNLDHHQWMHPCNNQLVFDLSYVDLFNKSIEDAVYKIKAVDQLKDNPFDLYLMNDLFHDISYNTGLPCSEPWELKFYDKKFADMLLTL